MVRELLPVQSIERTRERANYRASMVRELLLIQSINRLHRFGNCYQCNQSSGHGNGLIIGLHWFGNCYQSNQSIGCIGSGTVTSAINRHGNGLIIGLQWFGNCYQCNQSGRFTGLNKTLYFCRKMPFYTRFNTDFLPDTLKTLIISISFEYLTD